MSCYEYGPEHEGEDVRTSCETEGAGTYVGSCPLEDRIGGCNLGDYGTAWYYVGDSAESQMEFCAMIPDAPWVDP